MTEAEAIQQYGNPHLTGFYGQHIVTLTLPFALRYTKADGTRLPVASIRVHRQLESAFAQVFAAIQAAGLEPLAMDYAGTYALRAIRGGAGHLSAHAFGAAIDLNATTLPLGSSARQDPRLDALFAAAGFVNGADFHGRKDPMHYSALGW